MPDRTRPFSPSVERIAVFAADVGSKEKFGWACLQGDRTGNSLDGLASAMIQMANDGWYLTLGFECPLSIPCGEAETDIGKQREGERGKPWSAGAGANAAVYGVQQLCWLLRVLKVGLNDKAQGTLDWSEFETGGFELFVWEAFVTGTAKRKSDIGDAQAAVDAFGYALPDPRQRNCVTCEKPISIAGMALLWAGLTDDSTVLRKAALVLKP